jgi:alpha-1,3-mannosylglycoprotein beta-1,4-N-acetylglucosaminyltransferase A/B
MSAAGTGLTSGWARTKDNFFIIGTFNKFGVAEGSLGPDLPPLEAFRLTVHTASENWAILSEIHFRTIS